MWRGMVYLYLFGMETSFFFEKKDGTSFFFACPSGGLRFDPSNRENPLVEQHPSRVLEWVGGVKNFPRICPQ